MFESLIIAFSISLLISIIFVLFGTFFKNFGLDEKKGIQKIHIENAIRIGSIPIILSFILVSSIYITYNPVIKFLLISLLPAVFGGLYEDLIRNGSITTRFVSIIASSVIFVFLTGSYLEDVNVAFLNYILNIPVISVILTVLGISIAGNSFNFIDGVNGLCSGLSISYLIALYFLCLEINEFELANALILIAFSILGFLVVNIITGKLFLGDAGAYCLGILIGCTGVYISSNNNVISPWVVFFIIIYPALEFSMSFIRRIINKKNPSLADNEHLHSLFYKLILIYFENKKAKNLNSICGLFLVIYGSIPALTILYIKHDIRLIFFSLIVYIISFVILYLWCKRKLKSLNLK